MKIFRNGVGAGFFGAMLGLCSVTTAYGTNLPSCDNVGRSSDPDHPSSLTITCNPGGPPELVYLVDPNDPKGAPILCGCNTTWVRCNPNLNNPDTQTGTSASKSSNNSWLARPCATGTGGLKAIPSTFEYINDAAAACTVIGGTRTCFTVK